MNEHKDAAFVLYDRYAEINNRNPYIGYFTLDNVKSMPASKFDRLLYIGSFTIRPFTTQDGVLFDAPALTAEQEVIRNRCFDQATINLQ